MCFACGNPEHFDPKSYFIIGTRGLKTRDEHTRELWKLFTTAYAGATWIGGEAEKLELANQFIVVGTEGDMDELWSRLTSNRP